MKKIVVAWVICVLGLVVLFAFMGGDFMAKSRNTLEVGDDRALIKAEFTLQNAHGNTVTATDFRGRYLLVYFGFTHCPDICPTSLLLMSNALKQLGKKAASIQPVFITVDPERDTPTLVNTYVSHFDKNIVGLSGTPEQIKEAAYHFKVFYSKVETKESALGYVVDHSGFIYLMGPDGNYITHFPSTVSEQELTQGLHRHVR